MASKDFAILDIQNDNDELHFQDFGLSGSSSRGSSQTHIFTDFPDSPGHQNDRDKLLGEYQDDEETTPKSSSKSQSFWSFEYYQQYFDVDSKQVGDRIMWSMVPKPGVNYLEQHIRPKPDLYGPFWVCLTLVFAAAIAGNVSNYLQTFGDQSQHWRYDFHKVSLAAGMVFSYGWLLPLLIWAGLRYKFTKPPLSLLDLTCLYGYSLSVLVPVCLVWTAPIVWLRWCVGIVGVVLSGVVLAKAVWEGLKGGGERGEFVEEDDSEATRGVMKKVAMAVVLVVVVMHVAIAMGFMLYFFSVPAGGSKLLGAPVAAIPGAVLPSSALPGAALPAPALPGDANARPTASPAAAAKDIVPTKRDLTRASSFGIAGGGGLAQVDGVQAPAASPAKALEADGAKAKAPAPLKQPAGLESLASPDAPKKVPSQTGKLEKNVGVTVKDGTAPGVHRLSAASPKTDKLSSKVPKQEEASVSKSDGSKIKVKVNSDDSNTIIDTNKLYTASENGAQVAANEPVSANNKGRPVRSLDRTLRNTNT